MRLRTRRRNGGRRLVAVGGQKGALIVVSAEVGATGADQLVVRFNDIFEGDGSGFVVTASGGAVSIIEPGSIDPRELILVLSRVIAAAETVTLAYTPGDMVSASTGLPLVAFSGRSVTNNVT